MHNIQCGKNETCVDEIFNLYTSCVCGRSFFLGNFIGLSFSFSSAIAGFYYHKDQFDEVSSCANHMHLARC